MVWTQGMVVGPTNLNAQGASATSSAGFSTNTLTTQSGATQFSNVSIWTPPDWVFLDAFGAHGDGVTDDSGAIAAAESARAAGGTLFFSPGKTYAVNPASNASLPAVQRAGYWRGPGATVKYVGVVNLTTGSDGGALGVVNVRASNVGMELTIDGNLKARYAVACESSQSTQVTGVTLQNTHQSLLTASGVWSGLQYAVSKDLSGSTISGRALNVDGWLRLPNCPVMNPNTGSITAFTSVTAHLTGGAFQLGNQTGGAWTINDTFDFVPARVDLVGIPQFPKTNDDNSNLLDAIFHDIGSNTQEGYGANAAINSQFSVPSGRTLWQAAKFGVGCGWYYGNAGTDSSAANVWFDGGSALTQGTADLARAHLSVRTTNSSGNSSTISTPELMIVALSVSSCQLAYRSGNTTYLFNAVATAL